MPPAPRPSARAGEAMKYGQQPVKVNRICGYCTYWEPLSDDAQLGNCGYEPGPLVTGPHDWCAVFVDWREVADTRDAPLDPTLDRSK